MKHSKILHLFQKHQTRQQGLQACLALLHLIELLQQHRGITLATQAGNEYFQTRLPLKQEEVNEALEKLKQEHIKTLSSSDYEEMMVEWTNILQHWPKADAFNNFLIHSHFIHRVQLTINRLITTSGQDTIRGLHQQLIELTLKKLPSMAEAIAQSRGLAVYLATTGEKDADFLGRLKYLEKDLQDHHQNLLAELKSIDQITGSNTRYSSSTTNPEKLLKQQAQFLIRHLLSASCLDSLPEYSQLLENLIQDVSDSAITPNHLFSHASSIIREIHQGINKVSRSLKYSADPDLSSWIGISQLSHA